MKLKLSNSAKNELKRLGVAVVYLIGSRATGAARRNSDYDFAVVMQKKESLRNEQLLYDKLYEILSKTLPKGKSKNAYPNNMINIDIIFLQTAPLYYTIEARDNGKVLFEISPIFRADFEERATLEYLDFEPFRRYQEFATLKMI